MLSANRKKELSLVIKANRSKKPAPKLGWKLKLSQAKRFFLELFVKVKDKWRETMNLP
jgi:hypothetical protein